MTHDIIDNSVICTPIFSNPQLTSIINSNYNNVVSILSSLVIYSTASYDAELLMKSSMLRRQSLCSEWKVLNYGF